MLMACLGLFSQACTTDITEVRIAHANLDRIDDRRTGIVLIRQFADKRGNTAYVGSFRPLFILSSHFAPEVGVRLDALLTKYFAEALREAGYEVINLPPDFPPAASEAMTQVVIDGEISKFWLSVYSGPGLLYSSAIRSMELKIEVRIKALEPATGNVLWEEEIQGRETDDWNPPMKTAAEKVIEEGLTKALNRAAAAFRAADFEAMRPKADP
jgi:hypothetical protein